jgi:hypothetical protein
MNSHLCGEFIGHLDQDGSLQCGHAPEHIMKWLEELNLPMDLLRFMQWRWPQSDGYIAHISVRSSVSIHADEMTSPLLKHKFLNAGFAPNGDWFVIDFSTEACVPGFVTHEEWCPWTDETEDARKFFQPIARSLESFLCRAVEGRYLPTDYYAAKEFNAFLVDERNA